MEKIIQALLIVSLSVALFFRFKAGKQLTQFGKSLKWYNPKNWYTGYNDVCKMYTAEGAKLKYRSKLFFLMAIGLMLLEKVV